MSSDFDPLSSDNESVDPLENNFNEAASHLQTLVSNLDSNTLLIFYGLYKQSTVGPCNTSKPGIFNMQGRAKWNAWNDLGQMTKTDAMTAYVNKLKEIDPDWKMTTEANSEKPKKSYWVSVSTPLAIDDNSNKQENKTFHEHVKDGNIDEIKSYFNSEITVSNDSGNKLSINEYDENGLGPIHWAADQGHSHILEVLLLNGADVNLVDSEGGQTALHYAISCGHIECVKVLKKHGADPTIKDSDEANCYDLASEMNEDEILELLKS